MTQKIVNRIELQNAKFVSEEHDYVEFDIAVDGNVVHSTLEWLDEGPDLVRNDSHLIDGDKGWKKAVIQALDNDEIDEDKIFDTVFDKLRDTVEELKEAA